MANISQHIESVDWNRVTEELNTVGWSLLESILELEECGFIVELYGKDKGFRSRVVMTRHGFGEGEYKYFSYPLPKLIAELRMSIYPYLVPIANQWNKLMKIDIRYPDMHATYLEQCHRANQTRPTPLLLQYGPGDYNCLHQDLYGEHVFPMQAVFYFPSRARILQAENSY